MAMAMAMVDVDGGARSGERWRWWAGGGVFAGDDVVWRNNGVSADVFGEQCQSLFSRHVE